MAHKRKPWDDDRLARLREMWAANENVGVIADKLETSRGAVYQRARKLGLAARQSRHGRKPGTALGKPDGARVDLEPWHPAIETGRTIHGKTVTPAARAKRMLKDAKWSAKIGSPAMKGAWKGFPLFTLTLEERATCPRTCLEWRTCYGNNLGHMTVERLFDDGYLETRLHAEIAHRATLYPKGFAIRLHVLGDFYSIAYVDFWKRMLREFDMLHLFGFTARAPADPIGTAVLEMMQEFDARAMLRFSGRPYPQLCSEVVDSAEDANFIICPAERKVDHDCARCGLCWTSDHSITFLRH